MDFANEKILITGGTGFLGANLAHYLVQKLSVPPKNIGIFYLEHTSIKALEDLPPMEMLPGNILDRESLEKAFKERTLVFHTVGSTSFEPRARKIQWLINVEGTRNVLEIAKTSNTVKRICHTSTVNVLGSPDPKGSIGTIETSSPYDNKYKVHAFDSPEETLEFADDVHEGTAPKKWWKKIGIGYFDSKLAAQELVNRAVREDNLDIVSVLPGTFFGPYDVFIGTSLYIITVYNNAIPGALKTGFPLVHVDDIVRGHVLAMEKGKKGEMYILGGQKEDNRYLKEMLMIIADVLQEQEPDRKLRHKFGTFPFFIAKIGAIFSELYSKVFKKPCILSRASLKAASFPSFYSYEKAERDLGYIPQKNFREAIKDAYNYLKDEAFLLKKEREMDKIILEKEKNP